MRLAERVSPTSWRLAEGWQQPLRELGARGDILKQIHAAISGDPTRYRIVRPGEALPADPAGGGQVDSGRVASKGLSDELKGTYYAVVETAKGRAYHVALDARSAEMVRPGDIVSLATRPEGPIRSVDRPMAQAARVSNAVDTPPPGGGDTGSDPRLRRPGEQEPPGLGTPEATDRGQSLNLVPATADRAGETPVRHRLLVRREPLSLREQVGHPGPVWLDRVRAHSLAPYVFGVDVRRALERRRDALRRLGVQPDDPQRLAKLRELQTREVGGEIAARSGQTFLPSPPDGFRGRVQLRDVEPSGGSYAVISDGQRFIVLRATAGLRGAEGKSVTVTRNARGRLVVRGARSQDIGL
jgi:hypothetical protein